MFSSPPFSSKHFSILSILAARFVLSNILFAHRPGSNSIPGSIRCASHRGNYCKCCEPPFFRHQQRTQ
uniref:Putative secreted protein n=1 Tax=Anopheles marajoara TaxID=58244 RepID=A0A2M4CFC9_9DIPT